MNLFGNILFFLFCTFLAVMYVMNILKLIVDMKEERYTLKTAGRGIGIFFPVVGVLMGFV